MQAVIIFLGNTINLIYIYWIKRLWLIYPFKIRVFIEKCNNKLDKILNYSLGYILMHIPCVLPLSLKRLLLEALFCWFHRYTCYYGCGFSYAVC